MQQSCFFCQTAALRLWACHVFSFNVLLKIRSLIKCSCQRKYVGPRRIRTLYKDLEPVERPFLGFNPPKGLAFSLHSNQNSRVIKGFQGKVCTWRIIPGLVSVVSVSRTGDRKFVPLQDPGCYQPLPYMAEVTPWPGGGVTNQ